MKITFLITLTEYREEEGKRLSRSVLVYYFYSSLHNITYRYSYFLKIKNNEIFYFAEMGKSFTVEL
jgi:hypothetical protein